ncbi:MAG: hypothetical protein Q9171_001745 [Xanthocarpia ochracea]
MNTNNQNHYGLNVEQLEAELCALLKNQEFNALPIDTLLQEYRVLYENQILTSFEHALCTKIEDRLWDAHVRINDHFRKQLGYFRDLKGKKKPVEQRKAAKLYLRFLKSSQRFYRGYLQRLATHSGGISEIAVIARKFTLDSASPTPEKNTQTTPELQHAILRSCHQTLMHLGDLSRYRELELDVTDKKKNWRPAIGLYDLAIEINPSSGMPHTQLAIIARIEGDHILTLYHLYRAQIAYEPPPRAINNLDRELKMLRVSLKPADFPVDTSDHTGSPPTYLKRCLPLLHSYYFGVSVSQEYNKVEDRTLRYLLKGLKERTLDTELVNMIVLSSIAADIAAGDRWQVDPEEVQNWHAFKSIQRLNLQIFSCLLRSLRTQDEDRTQEGSKIDKISSTIRRLLPSLRYYSAWLVSRAGPLSLHLDDSTMDRFVRDFWAIYTKTMSLLLSTTNVIELPRLEYLLEEDMEIIGFRPLQEVQMQRKLAVSESFLRRANLCEVVVTRQPPDIEMQYRIQDLLHDALELTETDYVPIELVVGEGNHRRFAMLGESIDSRETRTSLTEPSTRSAGLDMETTTNDTASLDASAPVLLNTTENQIEEDSVGPSLSNNMAPPASKYSTSDHSIAQANGANETSFAIGDSTLNALSKLHQDYEWVSQGHATQSQPNKNSQSQHVQSVKSTPSDMPDPTQAYKAENLPRLHPARIKRASTRGQHYDNFTADIDFNSPNIFPDSSDFIRRTAVSEQTPPNGQG